MVMAFSIFGWIDNSSELKVTIELNLSWAFTITLETVVSSIMNPTSWPFEGDTSLNSKHFSSFCFVFAFVDSFCLFFFSTSHFMLDPFLFHSMLKTSAWISKKLLKRQLKNFVYEDGRISRKYNLPKRFGSHGSCENVRRRQKSSKVRQLNGEGKQDKCFAFQGYKYAAKTHRWERKAFLSKIVLRGI